MKFLSKSECRARREIAPGEVSSRGILFAIIRKVVDRGGAVDEGVV